MSCGGEFNGRRSPGNTAVPAAFIAIFRDGLQKDFFKSCDDLEGIAWKWKSIDVGIIKTPTAQESAGANPSDRGENGKKRHVLVDERGAPLSIVVTGANRHDVTQIEAVLQNRIRKPRGRTKQNLCADAGYSDKKSVEIMRDYCYEPHIRPRGEEKLLFSTDSKRVDGLWMLSIPGSIG